MNEDGSRTVGLTLGLIVALVAAGATLYYGALYLHLLPASVAVLARITVAFVIGYAVIVVVGKLLARLLARPTNPRRSGLLLSFYHVVAYATLAIVLLLAAGVNSLAVLAGGTFAGLVIGLAAQTVLSNVIAGVLLLFVRPIEPGERITLTTWQYGLIAPAYPPKFYSADTLVPGYTGTVREVGLVYSRILLDEGPTMRIPNSILVQAAIISHDVTERWVRTRYEIPASLDPGTVIDRLGVTLPENTFVVDPKRLRVTLTSVTLASAIITVDAFCKGDVEEPARSALLLDIHRVVDGLRQEG